MVDVFLPDGPADTVVTFVHGGFWRAAYDRTHVRPLARALADDGFAVTLPEYRRVGAGGGWPTTCDDVRRGRHRDAGAARGHRRDAPARPC